jgi:hypothetical protein
MVKRIVLLLSIFVSGCSLRPWDDRRVTYCVAIDTPIIFKDPNVLSTGLNLKSSVVGLGAEVWKISLSSSGKAGLTHWLVLYPDGRLITSLDDDPEIHMINFMTSDAERRNLLVQRAIMNTARIDLLARRNSDALFTEIKLWSASAGRAFRRFRTIGRWDANDDMLRINIIDGHTNEGELPGPWWYEQTGVSQLVFRKEKAHWIMSQRESKTVWLPPSDLLARVTNSDYPCLYSLRSADVMLVKIDNFIPRPLPSNWKW